MGRKATGGATGFRFNQNEVSEMEKVLEASTGSQPARAVIQHLTESFTNSEERAGKEPIKWAQVSNWFHNKRRSWSGKVKSGRNAQRSEVVLAVPESQPEDIPDCSGAGPSEARNTNNVGDQELKYEAKSATDDAWLDVSTILSQRTTPSGDVEVQVRFAGFESQEDEWLNASNAVRERSIPCVKSECVAVLPGDLILCFQERGEQAMHFDADILDVVRRRHDARGCRCRFFVRYRHDQSEEVVPLRKVCRRPETEHRLQGLKFECDGEDPMVVKEVQQQTAASKPDPPLPVAVDGFASPANVPSPATSPTVLLNSEDILHGSSTPATEPSTMVPTSPATSPTVLLNSENVLRGSSTPTTEPSTMVPT